MYNKIAAISRLSWFTFNVHSHHPICCYLTVVRSNSGVINCEFFIHILLKILGTAYTWLFYVLYRHLFCYCPQWKVCSNVESLAPEASTLSVAFRCPWNIRVSEQFKRYLFYSSRGIQGYQFSTCMEGGGDVLVDLLWTLTRCSGRKRITDAATKSMAKVPHIPIQNT